MLQEEMINIIGSASVLSTPPFLSEYKINSAMRSERRGHTKGVGRQLKRRDKQAGPSSSSAAASGSSSSIAPPTSSQPIVNPEFVQQKF